MIALTVLTVHFLAVPFDFMFVYVSQFCLVGYKHVRGQVLDANELKVLFEGLKLNNLHHFSHLLTGMQINR